MDRFIIRESTKEDCTGILRLIKELAIFEKMEDSFHMTVDILQKDGFGENPIFRCLVAEEINESGNVIAGKLIAYSIFYYIYSTWEGKCIYLEDLYITPTHRKLGIGSAIFKKLTQICVEEGCKRLQWAVLDWNKPAMNFYKKFGAQNLTEKEGWHLYRLEAEDLKKLNN